MEKKKKHGSEDPPLQEKGVSIPSKVRYLEEGAGDVL
jgi:hypothetical protein